MRSGGSPMAKYALGTHLKGETVLFFIYAAISVILAQI